MREDWAMDWCVSRNHAVSRYKQDYPTRRRRLQFESLEDRRLLSITVNTVLDIVDPNNVLTTLREAAQSANSLPGAVAIEFPFAADFGAVESQPLSATLSGDYNADAVVDSPYVVVWRRALSDMATPYRSVDVDGSGIVDQGDANAWRAQPGQSWHSNSVVAAGSLPPAPTPIELEVAIVGFNESELSDEITPHIRPIDRHVMRQPEPRPLPQEEVPSRRVDAQPASVAFKPNFAERDAALTAWLPDSSGATRASNSAFCDGVSTLAPTGKKDLADSGNDRVIEEVVAPPVRRRPASRAAFLVG